MTAPGGYEHLRRMDEGSVATVALARPESHNALNAALIEELTRCFEELAVEDSVRAVVLTGEGQSFCAGADIGYMRDTAGFSYEDRKSTRLNSSHANISYAVFCLKKKKRLRDEE